MKKLIPFLALTIISVCSFAYPGFTIINSSFNDSTPVAYNSSQWVDIKHTSGSTSTSDSVKIYIQHINPNTSTSNAMVLFRERFYDDFMNTPTNTDGSTRIYFNMPDINYPSGKFAISVNVGTSKKYGLLESATSITEFNPTIKEQKSIYYNSLGQQVIPTTGFYIQQTGTKSKKIYIIN